MLGYFPCFCCRLLTFFLNLIFQTILSETMIVLNGLDLDQGPDLGQNCLQKLPAYNKSPS